MACSSPQPDPTGAGGAQVGEQANNHRPADAGLSPDDMDLRRQSSRDASDPEPSGSGRGTVRQEPEGREKRDSLLRDSLLVTAVEGMHSHRCEETIVRAVTALPGVREVEVDFASGQASVIFDARKVSGHQVITAIEHVGYRCADPVFGSGGGPVE